MSLVTFGSITGSAQAVVGGEDASDEYPWAAQVTSHLQDNYDADCTGALIADEWVVTAAHCIVQIPEIANIGDHPDPSIVKNPVLSRDDVRVHIGSNNRGQGEFHRAKRLVKAPNNEDVALIELAEPSTKTPIPIAESSGSLTGRDARILGWGDTLPWKPGCKENCVKESEKLKQLNVSFMSIDENIKGLDPAARLAWYQSSENQTGQGDSGGPVMVKTDNHWKLVGTHIGSGTVDGGDKKIVGFSSNITNFLPWIKSAIFCPKFSSLDRKRQDLEERYTSLSRNRSPKDPDLVKLRSEITSLATTVAQGFAKIADPGCAVKSSN
ncbi:S1 family peptidase [Amycolatopsis sp. cmx-11-12]|uniref:S1 family peptidase n=1 Tax=Amycolatopsis sp. cmx-11-12 TaxID=2785795 RepID=UPI003917CAAD